MNSPDREQPICFLTNAYPDDEDSYRGIFIRNLAERLNRRGYSISVVTPRIFKKSPLRENRRRWLRVRRFPFWSEERLLITYRRVPWFRMVTYFLSGLYHTWKAIRRDRCLLIHAHWVIPTGLIGTLIGRLLRVPVVVHARGSDIHTFSGRGSLLFLLARFTLTHADAILAVSEKLKGAIAEEFAVQPAKIQVNMNGVDTSVFRPLNQAEQRRKLNLPLQHSVILFVGGLVSIKGLDYLIRAVPVLRESHGDRILFVIVGEGDLDAELRQKTRVLGIDGQFRFVGKVPNDQIPVWMNAADVVILPSLNEGMPNTVLEALSCGVPVVATRVGGTVDLIQDGVSGLFIEPASCSSIVEKINLILGDKRLYEKLRRNARKGVIQYDTDRQLAALEKVYQPFLCRRRKESVLVRSDAQKRHAFRIGLPPR